nr:MAG TPA: hypothetical protein [Caudoviricetes sp.]
MQSPFMISNVGTFNKAPTITTSLGTRQYLL